MELHLDPLQMGLRPTREAARWERVQPLEALPGALMLSPEDQVIQLSVHVHKHGFSRLIWLKDIDLLVRAYGDTLDWQTIRAGARAEGVAGSVWYALWLAGVVLAADSWRGMVPNLVLMGRRGARLRAMLSAILRRRA